MKQAFIDRFGEHRVSDAPFFEGVPLLVLDLELKSPVTVIVTNGLRDYKMPVPEKWEDRTYNELYFCLPSYWEWEDVNNPNTNWVFEWIQRLAKHVVEKETWYGHGHTIPCGKDPQPLSNTMKQNYFFLSDPMLLEDEMAPIIVDGKKVNFLGVIPIFKSEMDYKQHKGPFKFVQKLVNKGVTEKLDDFRSSVLKNKWRLKRQ